MQAACAQEIPFYEIIVVDNNSADATPAIARRFPGVKVVRERLQGKVHARTTGFNTAKGEIIARIDADTILPPNWCGTVQTIFARRTIDAVSGMPNYYDLAFPRLANAVEHFFRRWLARALRETLFLQGANMAVRRSAWQAVRAHTCVSRHIHEDFDVAIHLQTAGYAVVFEERLVAGLSARCVDADFKYFLSYVRINPYSYAVHGVPHYRRMYPVLAMIVVLFFPARMLFRARDPRTGKFSWARLFAERPVQPRIDPGGVYLS